MVVRGKGRRKISVGDTEYIWYVEMDYDSPYHILHIVSMDKHLILARPIDSETPYIISNRPQILAYSHLVKAIRLSYEDTEADDLSA